MTRRRTGGTLALEIQSDIEQAEGLAMLVGKGL